jgi:hypothetical protein
LHEKEDKIKENEKTIHRPVRYFTLPGKMMKDTYNDFSELQRAGAEKALEILISILFSTPETTTDRLNVLRNKQKLIIGDFGCSAGKNSLLFLEGLLRKYQERFTATEMHGILSDLPQNDYNRVFSAYQSSSLFGEKGFFLSTSIGSLYQRIFPSSSLDVAVSCSTLHWMSLPVNYMKFHDSSSRFIVHAKEEEDCEMLQLIKEHGKKDLQNFLLSRVEEVKDGGLILFTCRPCENNKLVVRVEDNQLFDAKIAEDLQSNTSFGRTSPLVHRTARSLGELIAETMEKFNLDQSRPGDNITSSDFHILPVMYRSPNDITDAISSHPVLACALSLVYNESIDIPNTIWEKYLQGTIDEEAYVEKMFGFIFAWSEIYVTSILKNNPEAIDYFYREMKRRIGKQKEKWVYENRWLIVCLQKKAES